MKKVIKILGITFITMLLLSTTYKVNALDNTFLIDETESVLELEDWMLSETFWSKQDTVIGTPMLAITPDGDTIQILLEDVVKAKNEKKEKRPIVVNNYTYYNYDNWRFFYNDFWYDSYFWYNRYYHVHYPIVYYYTPVEINRYYKKHNIKIIEHRHQPNRSIYTRPKGNPYKSKFNRSYENQRRYQVVTPERRNSSSYTRPKEVQRNTQYRNNNVYRDNRNTMQRNNSPRMNSAPKINHTQPRTQPAIKHSTPRKVESRSTQSNSGRRR